MDLINYAKNLQKKDPESREKDEIFKFVHDERLLRALFEAGIFELRNIQKEAIKNGLFFRKSFLVCAPSGSGKTLIGELCAINNVFQNYGKSAYLVPFKALATEKYVHFKKYYEKYGVKIVISIGDYDVDDSKLEKADIVVTTYEKMDSILRNFSDKAWVREISTIIVDEIHSIEENSRGPRLESLIVRLNEFLHEPQIIGLSATIANAKVFNEWLNSLGNETVLVKSDHRPVPLHFSVVVSRNKDSSVRKIVISTLKQTGQMLVFLNKRKTAQKLSSDLSNAVRIHLTDSELATCGRLSKELRKIKGNNEDLRKAVRNGVAFHHAGLLLKERKLIEDYFRKRIIKVICCTTTLSAGINTPARVVVLRDFKKYVASGHNIKDFSGYYENGDGFSYFKPFSANEVFQILGRAGRPGLDDIGYGVIFVGNVEEKAWVEDHYFKTVGPENVLIPKYDRLKSGLNNLDVLREQVLLRIYDEKKIALEKLKKFFEKTYFWHEIKDDMNEREIPIDQLLMIGEISPTNALKLHSNPEKVKKLHEQNYPVSITSLSSTSITGIVKTNFGAFKCKFDGASGVNCSCGFKNELSDGFADRKLSFEFCDHVTKFLLYLIEVPDKNLQKYVNDIVPKSINNQRVLKYLFDKGLIFENKDGAIQCSQFGKLIIRLYLDPISAVLIRQKLERLELNTPRELIKEACDVLRAENKFRDDTMVQPLTEWVDEEPLEQILNRYELMTGDLYSARDNLERIVTFIGIVARYLSEEDASARDKLIRITEMCETLKIRVHYGIKEELFDLVLRLESVARTRARILFNAGYRTADKVKKEAPRVLNSKTGFVMSICKKIIEGAIDKKRKFRVKYGL